MCVSFDPYCETVSLRMEAWVLCCRSLQFNDFNVFCHTASSSGEPSGRIFKSIFDNIFKNIFNKFIRSLFNSPGTCSTISVLQLRFLLFPWKLGQANR